MNVSFIGAGNLAWHLAPALDNSEYSVKEVYSVNPDNARDLVDRLYHAEVKETLDFSASPSTIFVIAASDDAIADIAREIALPEDALLVHTSGSQPLTVLEYAATPRIGVLYPLQTFTKQRKVALGDVPFFIESDDAEAEAVLLKMARSLSKHVHKISSSQRQALHVAAVFASNFTNHMFKIAEDVTLANKLDFDWLKPLIAETVNKSLSLGPGKSQTGPARRGDLEVLDQHLEFLQEEDTVAAIYKIISQHILDTYVD